MDAWAGCWCTPTQADGDRNDIRYIRIVVGTRTRDVTIHFLGKRRCPEPTSEMHLSGRDGATLLHWLRQRDQRRHGRPHRRRARPRRGEWREDGTQAEAYPSSAARGSTDAIMARRHLRRLARPT